MDEVFGRKHSRGNYDTDFSNIKEGAEWPSKEVRDRNRCYRFNKRLLNGEYGLNKKLVAIIDDVQQEINYKQLTLNRFELVVNKLDSLLFGNEATIQTGDLERDKDVKKLVERTHWLRDIRKATKICLYSGDAIIKTGRHGISAISPTFGYKVVDISDKNKVLGYVLHELLYDTKEKVAGRYVWKASHIRILISCKGYEYERVFEYKGGHKQGILGKPVKYKYKDRWISKKGNYYYTDIEDCETVQWLSMNTEKDGLYGASAFDSLKDVILAIETRLSCENYVVDQHGKPILLLGMVSVKPNEKTGTYSPAIIDGKYMIQKGQGEKPEFLTWDGKLDNSKQIRDDLIDEFYELSEMGRCFLTGEFSGGNISEETMGNMIKSAIDRANRDLNDIWYDIRKSLYVLCKLNDIDVKLEDLNIDFQVGRVDNTKVISEICKTLSDIKLFSKQTLLSKFFGYTEEDAKVEFERIQEEANFSIGGNEYVRENQEMDQSSISESN